MTLTQKHKNSEETQTQTYTFRAWPEVHAGLEALRQASPGVSRSYLLNDLLTKGIAILEKKQSRTPKTII